MSEFVNHGVPCSLRESVGSEQVSESSGYGSQGRVFAGGVNVMYWHVIACNGMPVETFIISSSCHGADIFGVGRHLTAVCQRCLW